VRLVVAFQLSLPSDFRVQMMTEIEERVWNQVMLTLPRPALPSWKYHLALIPHLNLQHPPNRQIPPLDASSVLIDDVDFALDWLPTSNADQDAWTRLEAKYRQLHWYWKDSISYRVFLDPVRDVARVQCVWNKYNGASDECVGRPGCICCRCNCSSTCTLRME
jgi:hypothetical protein